MKAIVESHKGSVEKFIGGAPRASAGGSESKSVLMALAKEFPATDEVRWLAARAAMDVLI
jgi:class 3 adenylate cyclase